MGNRVAKTVLKRIDDPNNPGSTMPDWDSEETTLYVRDASGNVMATYTLEIDPITDEPIVKDEVEYTIYGSSRLGITKLDIDEQLENLYSTENNNTNPIWIHIDNVINRDDITRVEAGDFVNHNGLVYVIVYVNMLGMNEGPYENMVNVVLQSTVSQINEVTFARTTGKKMYELSNHLGNVGVVISDMRIGIDENNSNTADYYLADVLNATDVYPFGMPMPGRSYTSESYRFGFNGQEKENDLSGTDGGHLVFTYRIHDARLGRFLSVDPLASSYPELSTYQFAGNTPNWAIDLEGLEAFVFHYKHIEGNDKPTLNIIFDESLKNNNVVYTIHDYFDSEGNHHSRSTGSVFYSDLPQYFPNFAQGNSEKFTLGMLSKSFGISAKGNILSGYAGADVVTPIGDVKLYGKLGSMKLLEGNFDTKTKFNNDKLLSGTTIFSKNNETLTWGGGVGFGASFSYENESDMSTNFKGPGKVSGKLGPFLPAMELDGNNFEKSNFNYTLGVGGGLGAGGGVELKFSLYFLELDKALKSYTTNWSKQEKQILDSNNSGQKDFNHEKY